MDKRLVGGATPPVDPHVAGVVVEIAIPTLVTGDVGGVDGEAVGDRVAPVVINGVGDGRAKGDGNRSEERGAEKRVDAGFHGIKEVAKT